jgi:hypothetical protein
MSFNFRFHYFPRVGVVENKNTANSAQLELGLGLSLAKMRTGKDKQE